MVDGELLKPLRPMEAHRQIPHTSLPVRPRVPLAVLALGLNALLVVACSSPSPTPRLPTSPTPISSPPPIPVTTITGTVTATNDGVVVPGATVAITVAAPVEEDQPIATTTTDGTGRYSLTYQRQATYMRLTVSRDGMITRTAYIEGGRSRQADVDLFREDVTFHLRDFRVIARTGVYGGDPSIYPLTPVTRAVTLYMSTVTSWPPPTGKPVDSGRIDFVQNVIVSSIPEMTEGAAVGHWSGARPAHREPLWLSHRQLEGLRSRFRLLRRRVLSGRRPAWHAVGGERLLMRRIPVRPREGKRAGAPLFPLPLLPPLWQYRPGQRSEVHGPALS